MKSAVFYGLHDIRIEDVAKPVIKEHEVLIQVKACGVCGTDVHIYEGDPGAAQVSPPTILGHEFSGIITEVGRSVKAWKVGDRVCVDPNKYCGCCDPCRTNDVHFCEHMLGYGTTVNGGFAEYCAVHESQLYKLPENVSFEQGSMCEPVACCLHGIDLCELSVGANVVVIGAGMIGLIMIQLAKLSGAANVICLEPVEEKRKIAKKMGASLCLDPIHKDVSEQIHQLIHVDCVIECVGNINTLKQAIDLADYKATVMMFGLTSPDAILPVKPFTIFQKEIVLKSSYINPYTQKRALDLIASGCLDVSSMIYEICGFSQLKNILKDPKCRAKGKYIISPEKE